MQLDLLSSSRYKSRKNLYLEAKMLNTMFDRFAEQSPITVMARMLMERVFNPDQMDAWFDQTAKEQYTKELLFSSVFDIVSQVVCGKRPSISAAYQASREEIGVSLTSVYNKLNGIEPQTSGELVRYAGQEISPVIRMLLGKPETPCRLPHKASGWKLPRKNRAPNPGTQIPGSRAAARQIAGRL